MDEIKKIITAIDGRTMPLVLVLFLVFSVFMLVALVNPEHIDQLQKVHAETATTSVTVLNTPPQWTVDAQESTESSTNTPTNAGSVITFVGTGTDSNNDDYFLIICKTNVVPTPHSNTKPTCNGGSANQWAISATTTSGAQASAATTTNPGQAELNDWYAYICDANISNPACNTDITQQGDYPTESPYVVNHRPSFTIFLDTSPADPGQLVTFESTSTDSDVAGVADTVRLFVCKANDFNGTACGAGGTWCKSGGGVTGSSTDPYCIATLDNPMPDGATSSYGFIIDNHNFAATTTSPSVQGTNSTLNVNNVAPTIDSSLIFIRDTDGVGDLTLLNEATQTLGYYVKFTVHDDNSCKTAAGGNEIRSVLLNLYRSGIGQASCQLSTDYNANNCYPQAAGIRYWNVSSTSQEAASCTGTNDPDAIWDISFPLFYLADATDPGAFYAAQNWLASVQAGDDNQASSSLTEGVTGNEVDQFLSQDINTAQITYGSLQPGQGEANLSHNATTSATGNVGVNESISGADMCVPYPACSHNATDTIPSTSQQFGTTTTAYGTGEQLSSTTPALFKLKMRKSTATTTPNASSTVWAISVPSAITLAGAYTGLNTFVAVTSESSDW